MLVLRSGSNEIGRTSAAGFPCTRITLLCAGIVGSKNAAGCAGSVDAPGNARSQFEDLNLESIAGLSAFHGDRAGKYMRPVPALIARATASRSPEIARILKN